MCFRPETKQCWIKIDQLMSLVLLFHYLLLTMFRMLVHPSSGACDLLWIYFMCCIALVRCVLVLRWNKSTISRKLLKMDVLTFETWWAVNSEIIKQVTSSWSIFIQLCVILVNDVPEMIIITFRMINTCRIMYYKIIWDQNFQFMKRVRGLRQSKWLNFINQCKFILYNTLTNTG